jgi:predicted pyridoxine 5'-phosphate oxidase superfamily flavin-nucleotide-binding protein
MYHGGSRELQDRFDTRRLADRLGEKFGDGAITAERRRFIESRDMFFLATADAEGRPQCSYKGGDPGFVKVIDGHTLAFPNYDGNGMFLSMGNLSVNPHVGMLFIDFENPERLRINGTAHLIEAPEGMWPEAQFAVRVDVAEAFPNCPRYIHQMRLEGRSRFVPRSEHETPVPAWKRYDWARDVLPAGDPASEDPARRSDPAAEPDRRSAGRSES